LKFILRINKGFLFNNFLGFSPQENYEFKNTKENDAYSNQFKNNILDNLRESIPKSQVYRRRDRICDRKFSERCFSE
jgi:hypothetical protein